MAHSPRNPGEAGSKEEKQTFLDNCQDMVDNPQNWSIRFDHEKEYAKSKLAQAKALAKGKKTSKK